MRVVGWSDGGIGGREPLGCGELVCSVGYVPGHRVFRGRRSNSIETLHQKVEATPLSRANKTSTFLQSAACLIWYLPCQHSQPHQHYASYYTQTALHVSFPVACHCQFHLAAPEELSSCIISQACSEARCVAQAIQNGMPERYKVAKKPSNCECRLLIINSDV